MFRTLTDGDWSESLRRERRLILTGEANEVAKQLRDATRAKYGRTVVAEGSFATVEKPNVSTTLL